MPRSKEELEYELRYLNEKLVESVDKYIEKHGDMIRALKTDEAKVLRRKRRRIMKELIRYDAGSTSEHALHELQSRDA